MKKLGELRVGDPFYLLHYDGGYCELIEEHLVGVITEIKIGCIIKWLDEEGYIRGFTLEEKEYDKEDCTAAYCTIACASKERAKQLLDNDYKRFMNKYNKNIKVLNENKS